MCFILLLSALLCHDVTVTFYTPAEGWKPPGQAIGSTTWSGQPPYEGMAASNFLDIGVRFVLWDHEYIVMDKGGGLSHNQIDIFFHDKQRGYDWLWEHQDDPKIIAFIYDTETNQGGTN